MPYNLLSSWRKLHPFWTREAEYSRIPSLAALEYLPEQEILSHVSSNQRGPRWLQPTIRSEWYWGMLPWVLASALGKTQRQLPQKSSTSYLNGIRGIACLIVFLGHVSGHYYRSFNNPYGAEPVEENHGISQLPIIRIIYAGKGMVAVFFVLSGFVLSYSPLRKINGSLSTSSASSLVAGLCSSLLRRGVRLFAPMVVLVFLTCLVTWNYPSFYPGHWRDADPKFLQHLWRYVMITLPLFNPFFWDTYHPTSFDQCWTLAVEYRGSMVVFLMCVTTSRLTTRARKIVVLLSALWALHWLRSDVFCFLSGMFLAELRYCPLSDDFPLVRKCRVPWVVTSTLASCVLMASMLVIGWPPGGDAGIEPYKTIGQLIPDVWRSSNDSITFFWGSIGAFGSLAAIENLPSVQWVLSTAPILYFGEISFSFYLLHWMAYMWPGWEMMIYFTEVIQWSRDVSFYAMFTLTLLLLIVASDYFWSVVDERCVSMGKILIDWLGVHASFVVVPNVVAAEEAAHLQDDVELLPAASTSVGIRLKEEESAVR
ncbi:acyltransferase [Seiridium cupressi]